MSLNPPSKHNVHPEFSDKQQLVNISVKTINEISDKVVYIMKFETMSKFSNEQYEKIRMNFIHLFGKLIIEKPKDLSHFLYDNNEINFDVLKTKIDNNLSIFLGLILDNLGNRKDTNSINKILSIKMYNFLNILLVFGDNAEIITYNNLLKLKRKNIKKIKSSFSETFENLHLEGDNTLAIAYKSAHCKGVDKYLKEYENELKNESFEIDYEQIKKYTSSFVEIELKILIENVYDLYLKTLELGVKSDERLKSIKSSFNEFLKYIKKLYENDILTGLGEKKEIDYIFVLNTFIVGFDINHTKDDLFLKILNDTKLPQKLIKSFIENIDLSEQTKNELEKSTEKEKSILGEDTIEESYRNFFQLIFNEDLKGFNTKNINTLFGQITKNTKNSKGVLSSFTSYISTDTYDIDEEIIMKQIKEIQKIIQNSESNITSLMNDDVSHIQLLYALYIFEKTVDFNEEIGKINDKHPMLEKLILEKLGLNTRNQKINLKNRVHNLSVTGVKKSIEGSLSRFKRGTIGLGTYKVAENTILIKSKKLYLSDNKNASKQECSEYLDFGINISIKLLAGDNTDLKENSYVRKLQEYNVIGNNIYELSWDEKNNLSRIIKGLKIIKHKLNPLEEMLKVAQKDQIIIENLFSELSLSSKNDRDINLLSSLGPEKKFQRALEKLILKYDGDFHQMGDLNRFKLVGEGLEGNLNNFKVFYTNTLSSREIKKVGFEDWSGHPLSFSKKDSGYRDIKVVFTLKSGNVVEVQMHYEEMIKAKTIGYEITEEISTKIRREGVLLNQSELVKFKESLENNGKILDEDTLYNLSEKTSDKNKRTKVKSIGVRSKVSSDTLYNVSRSIDKESSLYGKLIKLERIIFNLAWAKVVIEYIEQPIAKKSNK